MLLLDDATIVYSATDLATAASCEYALLRGLDAKLGRGPELVLPEDAMLERAARLGDVHEARVLAELVERFGAWDPAAGTGVAQVERPDRALARDRRTLEGKHAETLHALRTGADVVFQAGFFDGRFGGWADFLVRERERETRPGAPVYAVHDTKLARHAKVTALLQLAAYADQLLGEGVDVAPQVHLVLGDRTTTSHRLDDLLPVYRLRRARLEAMLDEHQAQPEAVRWDDPRHRACGRCGVCSPEVERTRDVLLVAGMRSTQRARLRDVGITTVDELAVGAGPVEGIGGSTLERLRAQARLQVQQDPPPGGSAPSGEVVVDLFAPEVVLGLPTPDPGDIFFDFEGDPLWTDDGVDWGLEYLFGVVEHPEEPGGEPVFRAFWAHDRAEEKRALEDFLTYLVERLEQHPGMHVYHYASYEKTALLRLAGRHGTGEDVVDQLLRAGVLVDLYATVRASLRTGQRSYSLKKLEPLFMPTSRSGDVTTADASITEYADACTLRDDGDLVGWHERLRAIAEYNEYDCVATLRLRDWLRERAGARTGTVPAVAPLGAGPDAVTEPDGALSGGPAAPPELAPDDDAPEADDLADRLLAFADDDARRAADGSRTADQQAVALLAAALGYHWREAKPFWWGHYDRLVHEPPDWSEKRGTFVADEVEVLDTWHVPTGRRTPVRRLRLVGRLEPGSDLRPGSAACALYDPPVPESAQVSVDGRRGWTAKVTVVDVRAEGDRTSVRDVLVVDEGIRAVDLAHDAVPMALAPSPPPDTRGVAAAIRSLAEDVAAGLPELPDHPVLDLLRRRPPRTRTGSLPGDGVGDAATILAALADLDGSYLAVQGPPGTGKSHTGAHVIRELVDQGQRVAVVAQSHAVVENLLTKVLEAGVAPERIGKKPHGDADRHAWQSLKGTKAFGAFLAAQTGGYVVGGTMWDLTNPQRVPPEGFDVVVVDEAGQFSLANTVAVSTAGRNLLLLGDPQQLPQVNQGRHPEPVDRSALGWLTDGHDTLPPELGYFLARTWRMHPALARVVSRLSYDGRLSAVPHTAERSLDGIEPGVHCVLLDHEGNAVSSPEEADEVVAQVDRLVGRWWRDPHGYEDRPLAPADVIVVAPYNAQVWTIRRALDAAGYTATQVGTVDRFQGQQAAVVLVSTAASSADDVPRGMEFLLSRNRLNVAISRGKWAAVVVRSAGLTDHLPRRPEQLEELGAFIGVCEHVVQPAGATPGAHLARV